MLKAHFSSSWTWELKKDFTVSTEVAVPEKIKFFTFFTELEASPIFACTTERKACEGVRVLGFWGVVASLEELACGLVGLWACTASLRIYPQLEKPLNFKIFGWQIAKFSSIWIHKQKWKIYWDEIEIRGEMGWESLSLLCLTPPIDNFIKCFYLIVVCVFFLINLFTWINVYKFNWVRRLREISGNLYVFLYLILNKCIYLFLIVLSPNIV